MIVIALAIIMILFYCYVYWRESRGVVKTSNQADGSIISSAHLLASSRLASLHKGEIEGYKYNLISGSSGQMVVVVELGKNTKLHLVGVGSKSGFIARLQTAQLRFYLTQLTLEGDFPKYFTMYCSKDREQELLEVFDPADMAYFADFCQAYDFELFNDTLFMCKSEGTVHKEDTTSMLEDLGVFLKKNKRWLQLV